MPANLKEYIREEVDCMIRETGCASFNTLEQQNEHVLEWIRQNAARFRDKWEKEHLGDLDCGQAQSGAM